MAYDITDEMIAGFPNQYKDDLRWARENRVRVNYMNYTDFRTAERHLEGRTFQKILELGVLWGGSALMLSHFIPKEGVLLGIDSLQSLSDHPIALQMKMTQERILPVFDYISKKREISASFQKSTTTEWLLSSKEKYDLIHVDAGHDIESFFRDIILSYAILNDGGILLIDDCSIWKGVRGSAIGWRLIRDRVSPNETHDNERYGVITKNESNNKFFLPLVETAKVWPFGL